MKNEIYDKLKPIIVKANSEPGTETDLVVGQIIKFLDDKYVVAKLDKRDYDNMIILCDIDDLTRQIFIDYKRKDDLEILGRPITLEDILVAMHKLKPQINFQVDRSGGMFIDNDFKVKWHLNTPLSDQLDELGNLLLDILDN